MRKKILREGHISDIHLNSLTALFKDGTYGFDINYDPDFCAVKEEISKSKDIDYKLIEDNSYHIISQKCKDVRAFSYLALCCLKKNNWRSFCDIFEALSKICYKGFDFLFPLRLEAKRLAFKWLDESRFVQLLQIAEIPVEAKADILRLVEVLGILKEVLQQKFPDNSPFPFKLYAFVQKWIKSNDKKNEIAIQTIIHTDTKGIVKTATDSDLVKKETTVSSMYREDTPKSIIDTVRKNAVMLIEKEPESPIGYRLLRIVRWGSIELMPAAELNVTKIEPPAKERQSFLISFIEKREFKTALANAEKMFSSGSTAFWLDLQRISAIAAGNLGSKYYQVKEAIVFETAAFLTRYPLMRKLKFIDNTPFSNSETEAWLDSEVISLFCNEKKTHDNKNEIIKKEMDLFEQIASNDIDAGLELLTSKLSNRGNGLQNFRDMLTIASCMLSLKKNDISMFILESLYEKAETFHLEKWDTLLVVDLYILMIRVYDIIINAKQENTKEKLIAKRGDVMKRLCYLNPKAAFKIQIC